MDTVEYVYDLGDQRTTATTGVYFIACERFIKIGRSDKVEARLRELQTASPFCLQPLGFIQCDSQEEAQATERALHMVFAANRHKGEWFHDCERIRAIIASRATAWPTT